MTVLPGSLDYLYHNGILNHIPYEVYQMTPMTQSGMLQMSGMGTGLRQNPMMQSYSPMQTPNINNSQDMFSPQGGMYSQDILYSTNDNQQNIYSQGAYPSNTYSNKNMNSISNLSEKFSKTPTWIKGLLAGGIMLMTLVCMFRGGKKSAKSALDSAPAKEATTGMWNKIKGWFGRK